MAAATPAKQQQATQPKAPRTSLKLSSTALAADFMKRAGALEGGGRELGGWMLDDGLALLLRYDSVAELRGAIEAVRMELPSTNAKFVGPSQVYREPRGKLPLYGGKQAHLYVSWVCSREEERDRRGQPTGAVVRVEEATQRGSWKIQYALANDFISAKNQGVLFALLALQFAEAEAMAAQMDDDVISVWRAQAAGTSGARNALEDAPKTCAVLGIEGARFVGTNAEFVMALAGTLHMLYVPLLRPLHVLVRGRSLGQLEEAAVAREEDGAAMPMPLSAEALMTEVSRGLVAFRAKYTDGNDSVLGTRSQNSKLCRVDVNYWYDELLRECPALFLLVDGVTAKLEGPALKEACGQFGRGEGKAYSPLLTRRAVTLLGIESLLVTREDMGPGAVCGSDTAYMRPPMLRALSQLLDNERVSTLFHGLLQFLNRGPSFKVVWETRQKVNALLVKIQEEELNAAIEANGTETDVATCSWDNEDKDAKYTSGGGHSKQSWHGTAGVYQQNPRLKAVRLGPYNGKKNWNLSDARKECKKSEHELRAETLDLHTARPEVVREVTVGCMFCE
jgi:hypothetical protein